MLPEQVVVQERQLDGVADELDLAVEAADVVVVDVGDLFEDELFDLALLDALVGVAGARLDHDRVPGAQRLVHQRVRQEHDALLVGVAGDQRPVRRAALGLDELLERHDLADALVVEHLDDVHGVVEQDFLAAFELVGVDGRGERDTELPPGREDVDGAVLTGSQEHAVAGRRLCEPVDLLFQRDDLLAGLLEGRHEPFVLLRHPVDLGLRGGEPLFQNVNVSGRFGESTASRGQFLLELFDLS